MRKELYKLRTHCLEVKRGLDNIKVSLEIVSNSQQQEKGLKRKSISGLKV